MFAFRGWRREREKKKYEIFQRKQPGWGEEEEVERENGPAAGGADHAPRLQLGRVFFETWRRILRESLSFFEFRMEGEEDGKI